MPPTVNARSCLSPPHVYTSVYAPPAASGDANESITSRSSYAEFATETISAPSMEKFSFTVCAGAGALRKHTASAEPSLAATTWLIGAEPAAAFSS